MRDTSNVNTYSVEKMPLHCNEGRNLENQSTFGEFSSIRGEDRDFSFQWANRHSVSVIKDSENISYGRSFWSPSNYSKEEAACSSQRIHPTEKMDFYKQSINFNKKIKLEDDCCASSSEGLDKAIKEEKQDDYPTTSSSGPSLCKKEEAIEGTTISSVEKFLKKKSSINCHILAAFYQEKMQFLIGDFKEKTENCSISQGTYDYNRVQFHRSNNIDLDEKMEIEVSDYHLRSFDEFFNFSNFCYFSKSPQRRLFQDMIKDEIDSQLKERVFMEFVHLSLGKNLNLGNEYNHWKMSVSNQLDALSEPIKNRIWGENDRKNFKDNGNFLNNHLIYCKKILIKQIMQHALFSILIRVGREEKRMLISRASISCFLNKYSDYFLMKMADCKSKIFSIGGNRSSYPLWKTSKNKRVGDFIDASRMGFDELLKSDHKAIRQKTLVLENTGFRLLTDEEFNGLTYFINKLTDFKGHTGIIERAYRHFYKDGFYKKYVPKESGLTAQCSKSRHQDDMCHPMPLLGGNSHVSHQIEEKSQSPLIKGEIKKRKRCIQGTSFEEKKVNLSKEAESYRQLICSFLQAKKKDDQSLISKDTYDYRRFQYKEEGDVTTEVNEKEDIEIMDKHLISLDLFLSQDLLRTKDSKRRTFQKELKEKVEATLKESVFIDFVNMSIPNKSRIKEKNYLSWKEFILSKINDLSNSYAIDVFGKNLFKEKNETDRFVNQCSFDCAKSLIRNVLRHALFSIFIEKKGRSEHFLISRVSFSRFLNTYCDYFLGQLNKFNETQKELEEGIKLSYQRWKNLKSEKINEIVTSLLPSFKEIVENDDAEMRKEVLVLEKRGFRKMTDIEFRALTDLIYRLVESKSISGLVNRATRHFYKERSIKEEKA